MPIGLVVEARFSDMLRQKLYTLVGTRLDNQFPAAELCSLQQRDLNTLVIHDYLVSIKGSGIRALLLINRDGSFFYTREHKFYYNEVVFPGRGGVHFDTVIDGEIDVETNTFMCFDLICIDGVRMVERSASTRLGILLEDVLKLIIQPLPFKIEMSRYERSYGLEILLKQDIHRLVFTPVRAHYTPKRTNSACKLFSWVDPEFTHISFKIKVLWDQNRKAHYQLLICEGSAHKYFDDFTPNDELYMEWKGLNMDGKIIDCQFDKNHETRLWENGYATTIRVGGWKFLRFRPDRIKADEENKLKRVWKSIMEPITREALEQAVEEMRLAWKRRENKPVDHHQHVDNEQHIQSDAPILKKSSMTEFDPPKHSTTAANVEQNQSLEKDSKVTQQTSMTEITIQKQTSESEIKIQKQTSTTEIHISGNTSMDDLTMITVQTSEEQILEEEYEEEVISSGIIIPIKSPIRQQLSPRDKKQEFINEQSNPSDAQNLFQNIAKGHLLKHENNFIPELPTAIPPVANESSSKLPAASTKSQDYDDEEEDDEIDNLYQQRYLKKNPPDTNKPKLNDIKVDELPSEQQSEISQSNEKKRSWLDMILN